MLYTIQSFILPFVISCMYFYNIFAEEYTVLYHSIL